MRSITITRTILTNDWINYTYSDAVTVLDVDEVIVFECGFDGWCIGYWYDEATDSTRVEHGYESRADALKAAKEYKILDTIPNVYTGRQEWIHKDS